MIFENMLERLGKIVKDSIGLRGQAVVGSSSYNHAEDKKEHNVKERMAETDSEQCAGIKICIKENSSEIKVTEIPFEELLVGLECRIRIKI